MRLVLSLLCAQAVLGFSSTAMAVTYTVTSANDPPVGMAGNCPGPACTLRDAIAAATSGSDTIVFAADMAIVLGTPLTVASSVTVSGAGHAVAVDGNHAVRVLAFSPGVTAQFDHLTIRNGSANSSPSTINGGGLYVDQATVTLTAVTLSNNAAANYGGGVYNNGTITLNRSSVTGNTAAQGGGFFTTGDTNGVYLNESVLAGNSANDVDGGADGSRGGGIFGFGSRIVLDSSTASGNSAGLGGAVYVQEDASPNAVPHLVLSNSTLSGNDARAFRGGAVAIEGNNAKKVAVVNSTFAGNTAHFDSADLFTLGATVEFTNSILAGGCGTVDNGLVDKGGNLDAGITCNFGVGSQSNVATLLLGALQDNGGPTPTILPGPGSAAIDAVACTNAPATDQRGAARPRGAFCDVGAVEVASDRLFANNFDGTTTP